MLLAIDPSVRSPGVALFDTRTNLLVLAARVKVPKSPFPMMAAARAIHFWLNARTVFQLVFEMPQIYRASKSKGDPNDLISLAGVAMAVAGLCDLSPSEISAPTPAEWIGNIPKFTTGDVKSSPRAQRILSRLSPDELQAVPNQHDAIDAVGLGLHRLGRLEPRRAFSNGRDHADP